MTTRDTARSTGRRAARTAALLATLVLLTACTAANGITNAGERHAAPHSDTSSAPEPTTPTAPAEPTSTPTKKPVVVIARPGDRGAKVREIQARLVQIQWLSLPFDGVYAERTTEAVRGFQAKRGFRETGVLDRRTWRRLLEMTRAPSAEELKGLVPPIPSSNTNTPGPLDPRCTTGRVLCIDKSSRTLRWVVDGRVEVTLDTRFGASGTPTREGVFSVAFKSRDHVSSLYNTAMPYAMFFDGGQAVHYSSDFAATGYGGASHGCVNIRDRAGIAALFDQVPVGAKVVVYWS